MNRKVVYNACYGGFGLSVKAIKRLYELKYPEKTLHFYKREDDGDTYTEIDNPEGVGRSSLTILEEDFGKSFSTKDKNSELYQKFNDSFVFSSLSDIPRHDPDLVQVVEELGKEASDGYSRLRVADIGESKYHIDEYDGYESVITQHAENYWL